MTAHLLLIAFVAALFYAVIPAIGAVVARARWRTIADACSTFIPRYCQNSAAPGCMVIMCTKP